MWETQEELALGCKQTKTCMNRLRCAFTQRNAAKRRCRFPLEMQKEYQLFSLWPWPMGSTAYCLHCKLNFQFKQKSKALNKCMIYKATLAECICSIMQVLVLFSCHSNITDLFCRSCCGGYFVGLLLLLNLSDPFVTSPHHLPMLPNPQL